MATRTKNMEVWYSQKVLRAMCTNAFLVSCSSDVSHSYRMLLLVASYFNSMLLLIHCETMWFISVSSTHHLSGIHVSSIQRLRVVYASSMYYRGISAMHPLSRHQLGIAFASSMHLLCIFYASSMYHVGGI